MAATVHGTAYVYGVGATAPTNATIISISVAQSDANVSEVADHTGGVISLRTDDQRDVLNMELRVTASYTENVIGSKLTIVGGNHAGEYMVETATEAHSNKDFVTYSVTATKREYLTLS